MKTKAEILEEFGCPTPDYTETVTMFYPSINDAMDEYAQQRAQEFAEWLGLSLYEYHETHKVWCKNPDRFTTSELYAKFQEERKKK